MMSRNYKTLSIFYLFCLFLQAANAQTNLNFDYGSSIYQNGYVDQPYIVVLNDDSWLCTFTTSAKQEGSSGQHIVSTRSFNQGKTWTDTVQIEPPGGPAASWAMPYLTPYGRVYVFYSFNGDTVTTLNNKPIRNDMLGWYCYKYTDNGGQTWSERYRLPLRTTKADVNNDWKGEVQIFWGIGKPIEHGKYMSFGLTKLGKYMLEYGEGWFFQSNNIQTEKDPHKINWILLPDGMDGVRNPDFGSVQEEFNLVPINGDTLYAVYRTNLGFIAETISFNNGHSWSLPDTARMFDETPLKNPRACPRIWKTKKGLYLLWFHNHAGTGFANRNPGWITAGKWEQNRMIWTKAVPIIYSTDTSYQTGRLSYPDLIEQNGYYYISVTNKETGRILRIPKKNIRKLSRGTNKL
ncbi:MAG: sialidase family protein [Bacteroidota bacterium]|nr:sialidase family protein [Bacteroidota bacterium]